MHILLRLLLLLCLSSGLLSLPLGLGLRGSLFFSGLSCSLFFSGLSCSLFFSGLSCSLFFSCLLGGCLFSCFLLLSYLLRFFLLRYIAGFTNIDNRLVPIFHGLDNPVRSSEHHFVRVAFHLIIRGGKTGILELVFHIGQRTPFLAMATIFEYVDSSLPSAPSEDPEHPASTRPRTIIRITVNAQTARLTRFMFPKRTLLFNIILSLVVADLRMVGTTSM